VSTKVCNFCGSTQYIKKQVEYIYRYQGQYMVFKDVPAEICLHCGMRYFAADVILAIEQRFFEIHNKQRQPDQTVMVPVEHFA